MKMILRGGSKLGLAILIASGMSSAFAYHQDKPLTRTGVPVVSVEEALSFEKSRPAPVEKPAKCYLALHLEMVGVPFAARAADTVTGIAQACDVEPQKKVRENRANSN